MMKQMFLYFGDKAPFLNENEDIGPALRPKLLEVLRNPQKSAQLHLLPLLLTGANHLSKHVIFSREMGHWLLNVTKLLTGF